MIHVAPTANTSIALTPGSGMYPRYVHPALPSESAASEADVTYWTMVRGMATSRLSCGSRQSVKYR
jgi:hypothetical protein